MSIASRKLAAEHVQGVTKTIAPLAKSKDAAPAKSGTGSCCNVFVCANRTFTVAKHHAAYAEVKAEPAGKDQFGCTRKSTCAGNPSHVQMASELEPEPWLALEQGLACLDPVIGKLHIMFVGRTSPFFRRW